MAVAPVRIDTFDSQLDEVLERICEYLQITPTMFADAESRYHAIGDWLAAENSPLYKFRPRIYSQGSVRIGTTVRPSRYEEYDLDLVCQFEGISANQIPEAVMLLDAIENRLRNHDLYRSMLERKNRCIRVRYQNKFHLDVLPACPDPDAWKKPTGCLVVPDRKLEDWKPSNPEGYAKWFLERCTLRLLRKSMFAQDSAAEPLPKQEASAEKAPLKRAVQLLKRARDIYFKDRPKQAPVSVVLTTLAATHYSGERTVHEAFGNVLASIVATIPVNGRLKVMNPMNLEEDFSEKWEEDPSAYQLFVLFVKSTLNVWRAIESGQTTSSLNQMLGGIFGEESARAALLELARTVRDQRDAGRLSVTKGGGVITPAAAAAISMRPHTFFGDDGE